MIGRPIDSLRSPVVFRTILVLTLLVASPQGHVLANETQARICRAAINFGQAEARTYLFGRAFEGSIPADQLTFISTNLGNASAEIAAAEELFGRPFSTEPSRQQAVARLIADVDGFAAATVGESFSHRAAKIQNLAGRYLSTLQATFVSSRPDAFQYNSTCDSLLFNACYFYGKATTASAFEDDHSEYYESGAISTFRTSVRDGLAIAMDGDGHTPPDGHARKICCTFGSPEDWKAMDSLQLRNSMATYAALQDVMLGIIADAATLDGVCGSSDSVLCGSSPRAAATRETGSGSGSRSAAGSGVVGTWACSGLDLPARLIVERDEQGRGNVTVDETNPIRPGDQSRFLNRYPASVNGGTVQWESTNSADRLSWTSSTTLNVSPDDRNLTGTRTTTTRYPSRAPSTRTWDVSCIRIGSPDTSGAQVPGPDASADVAAIADFVDAAAAATRSATPPAPGGERRWVLAQTLVNPKNEPTEFVDRSARFGGSYERWSVGETNMTYSTRSQDRGDLWYDVNLTVAFTKPPAQLIPGQTVNLSATFSHGGTFNRGNPGITFEYRGEGINLTGVRSQGHFPWAPGAGVPASISSSFVVPQAGSGEIRLHAFLWNFAACNVTWVYKAQ